MDIYLYLLAWRSERVYSALRLRQVRVDRALIDEQEVVNKVLVEGLIPAFVIAFTYDFTRYISILYKLTSSP